MNRKTVKEMGRCLDAWRGERGFDLYCGRIDYLASVEDNLFLGLDANVRKMFEDASGGELKDGASPAGMKALHSSSALVVNVFNYWRDQNDKRPLLQVLGIQDAAGCDIRFEEQCPTGTGSRPAHLDVFLETTEKVVAVESKFTEWVKEKQPLLKDAYFPNGSSLWLEKGWRNLHELAVNIRAGQKDSAPFKVLDVAQLMKHFLGLKNKLGTKPFELLYLYYDFPGEKTRGLHVSEIERFAELVRQDGLAFRAMSYQDFWCKLKAAMNTADCSYSSYVEDRYFSTNEQEG